MTMDGWQARTEEVAEFIAVDGFDAQLRQVVNFQITFGNENPEQQDRVWDSIKSMIRGLDGSPVRRGKKSNLPASVNVAVAQICGEVSDLAATWFDENSLLQCVLLKHGKAGGGSYATGADYGEALSKKIGTMLKKMYNDGSWDGTTEGLSPVADSEPAVTEDLSEEE